MNPDAAAFFAAHPDADYWYLNHNVRVPNPKLLRGVQYVPAPWPETMSQHGVDTARSG